MIDLKLVQKNPELLAKALADRHSSLSVDEFLKLDGRRRALLAEVEALKQKQNAASREVAQLKREGKDAAHMMAELGELSDRISLEEVLASLPAADQELIRLRFYAGRTQSDTARLLHTTQVQISRRERKILQQMRAKLLESS